MSTPEKTVEPRAAAQDAGATAQPMAALRCWPAAIILVLMLGLRLLPMLFESPPFPVLMLGFMGPPAAAMLLLPWWMFASRAPWRDKFIGLVGLLVIVGVTFALVDSSMQGMPNFMYQLPVGLAAFAVPLVIFASRTPLRLTAALFAAVVGFGVWDLLRFDGATGEFSAELSLRWSPTSEDEYLNYLDTLATSASDTSAANDGVVINEATSEWPAFRGRDRTNVIPEIVLNEDWDQAPPELVWKSLIGPGWSSFSVAGNRLFTQEQRGESEAVVCLEADSGEMLWAHEYPGRFWEAIGGAGPRATPTIGDNALYCVGANGAVLCLEPATGELIWERDLRKDTGREPPMWGWSSSPLVVDGKVIVHGGGEADKGVIAYDASNGDIVWSVASGDHSYSSAQLAEFDGERGVLMVSNDGLQFLDVQDGHTIWNYSWESENYRVLQPLIVGNAILLASSLDEGTRRISVARSGEDWDVTEDWTTRAIKPQYNDYVLYEGHVYGFDGSIFASLDVETGEQDWKRGRYGNGQVLLLEAAGQLLLTSEQGELVLLKANPERLEELAKFPAIEGKTWNHPVLIGDRLYVRNGQEAACFKLPLK